MASKSRSPTSSVEPGALDDLSSDPQSYSFFQAVRLLERMHTAHRRVGGEDEVVRFTVNPSLAFSAGQIQNLDVPADGPATMEVNLMGLVGHQGVLPTHYSRLLLEERQQDNRPLTDFFDIFQHRLLWLFYRAWERARFYVPFERGDSDPVSRHLLDLIGLGHEQLRRRMAVRDETFLYYCGLLGMRQRSGAALQQLLEDYFDVPVEIEQFVGGWYSLSETFQCRIDDEPLEYSVGLGDGTVLGDEVWDPQARVRIRIGPLPRERYDEFLPGCQDYEALRSITGFFSDDQFDFEMQLVLAGEDVPGIVLGSDSAEDSPPLGWSTWIRTRPLERDADETSLPL